MKDDGMKLFAATAAAVLLSMQAGQAENLNRHVVVQNDTGFTMTRFYASNRDSSSWEEDIFGEYVLPAHSAVDVNIDDGTGYCIYDLKAVFEDGDEVERRAFNVCELGKWIIN
jgi:hypothetical protein